MAMADPLAIDRSLAFGAFRLFPSRQLLLKAVRPIRIGTRALAILELLVGREGDLVSKEELIAQVWPSASAPMVIGRGDTDGELLARDPELRRNMLGAQNPAPKLGRRAHGFNGRSTDAAGGIWGRIAEQLGKAQQFARYISPLLNAPGPEAWKQLLGSDPLVCSSTSCRSTWKTPSVPVGNADLGVVTTTALANLFVAVAEMDNVCLVLSDLAGTNFSIGQSNLEPAFNRAVHGITSERSASRPQSLRSTRTETSSITSSANASSSMWHQSPRFSGAAAYREALREANRMNLTTTSPEAYTRVVDAYPYDPKMREAGQDYALDVLKACLAGRLKWN